MREEAMVIGKAFESEQMRQEEEQTGNRAE